MAAMTDAPRAEFRLGMLWTDTRYRSLTIQIIALILVILGVSYLVSNVLANLAALGKTFDFGFLEDPASYDINQRLIEYDSRSSHATAAVVGILNTLLVAFLGCITATVLGVVAGVLRLSNNWLISKVMTVYIELVRNVPVLIQILLLAAVFDEFLPSPRQAEPWTLFGLMEGGIVATNRGFYVPGLIFGDGSVWVVLAFIAGVIGSVWYARKAKAIQQDTGRILPVGRVRLALWVVPPLVMFLLVSIIAGAPIAVEEPALKGFNFQGGIYMRNSLVALWLALSIYTGAFIAENVRAGIQSVSKGQSEAAFALGLRPNRTMSLVILPQALRVIIPPLISQYLNLTKNSSLAIAVGYMDATGTLGGITLNQTGREFETLLLLMAFYLCISLTISMIMNLYNEQVKLVERTSASGTTFTMAKLFDKTTGPWDNLKKGDAAHKTNYGVAGFLNLVVLLYAAILVGLLDWLFLAHVPEVRIPYVEWSFLAQLSYLALTASCVATLLTGLFKHFRVADFATLTAVLWVVAALCGADIGGLLPMLPDVVVVVGGLALQLAAIAYLMLGDRPNVTYLTRVKRDA
ncbi:L-glutamine ABC transporter membrane protein /L-glutamate ABC transporter membrane protein /L-aspartate ABC transporter membrane protein /L-asparagine ABC transporter membrane protein [Albimonas donghaensis]|uniref:L-glutamine ABC transporter membrane protein /L-glutamate ABC transporter membrane protein /L-aspartate ABC transporter membrane protein /L-asparagine ABC transporter membrane protein n=1 Tax=Albimonas donghaensis TaxID=356660 RepID=A0A1H3D882_9RHOB|nr:L-glutamine ABC transporter membrane protein /L-glutamate ABC transporter membrane protein /L-aspartate ABC transporter membrane protein /L-asparagine ABC transporter membrane protein [Albimonas donghaensis]